MDELIGKTIVSAKCMSRDWDAEERWEVICSDGTVFNITAYGHAYCTASIGVEEITDGKG